MSDREWDILITGFFIGALVVAALWTLHDYGVWR